MSNQTFLITAATGKQGGAAARFLLQASRRVRILVRDPASPLAQSLQALGADLSQGSFDDPSSLRAACANITRKMPYSAARAAGVRRIVYTSLCETGQHEHFPDWENWPAESGLKPYFLSKATVEDLIRRASFQHYTIFRLPIFTAYSTIKQ